MSPDAEPDVSLGEVVGPFGVKGELKVVPLTDFPERLARLPDATFLGRDGARRRFPVRGVRYHKGMALFSLAGVDTVEAAEVLRGSHLVIPASQRTPLPANSFYVDDLIGVRVRTEDGRDLGSIRAVHKNPANDVYDTGEVLIPALKRVVLQVDLQKRSMVIRPLPGMLDDAEEAE